MATNVDDVTQENPGARDADLEWLYGGGNAPDVAVPAPKPVAAPVSGDYVDDLEWLYGGKPSADNSFPSPEPAPRVPRVPSEPSAPVAPGVRATAPDKPAAPGKIAPLHHPKPAPPPKPPPRIRAEEPAAPRTSGRLNFPLTAKTLAVILALWVSFLIYAPIHGWSNVPKINEVPAGARPPKQPGTAILLVGTDGRDSLTPEQQQQLGTGGGGIGSRTDTMLIYYIPPRGNPALISLPRDTYLPIPGHNKNKLNAAYALGGPSLLVQTVEQATGIRIDGYLEIGFGGFVQLVDLVGGIEVCLDQPVVDQNSNLNLPAGCQTLDGVNALGYVRQRYQDPMGDLGRVERQREVIGKLLKKLARPSTVLNPVRYWRVCQALPGIVTKGQSTGLITMAQAAIGAMSYAKGNAYSLTVPISDPNASTPAGSSVLWDEAKAKELFGLIAKGDTSGLDQFVK